MKTDYPGIDYSLGQSNVDKETGIHYGVIGVNVPYNCAEEFFDNAEDLSYKEAVAEKKKELNSFLSDFMYDEERIQSTVDAMWDECEQDFNDNYECDNPARRYQKDGYVIENVLDNDLIVIKSPYYTYAQFCSPCIPGAGNLDSPCESGAKTYCLGPEWFENDKAPYRVWRVIDDSPKLPNEFAP